MNRIALALLATSAVLFAGAAEAQQSPTPPAAPFIDWDKIQIKTTDLGNNTYMLEGQGGNITVAVGTDGIIMVDGQFAPLSRQDQGRHRGDFAPARSSISSTPITTAIIPAGTDIPQGRRHRRGAGQHPGAPRRRHRQWPHRRQDRARPADALPTDTYIGGSKTVQVGGRTAQLTHVYNAHTDGDTWVYFADANVLCTGDTFNNTKRYQTIDFANGGDIRGLIRAPRRLHQGRRRPDQDRARPWQAREKGGHRDSARCW